MAVISIINISKLKGARRVDPEYYQPFYLALEKEVNKLSNKKLKNIAWITDGIHSSIDYDSKSQIRVISAQSVRNNDFDLSANTRISVEQHQKNLRTALMTGDIIISSVGTIGNTAVVSEKMLPCNADRHVAIVRLRNKPFNAFFISAFLNSKYGKFQTLRESTGNVQLNLFIEKVETLIIPDINNSEQIGNLTKEATLLLEKSRDSYLKAETLLLDDLGLRDYKPKYALSYVGDLSEAFGMQRVDAEYFQPAYDKVTEKVLRYSNGYAKLLDYVRDVKANFEPSKYSDKIFSYIELADIDSSIGVIDSATEIKGEEAPSRARRILKENDVIASSVEGSLEKVALVDKAHQDNLASTGFFQLRAVKIPAEVVIIMLKSIILQMQLKRECSGTILTAVPSDALRKIVIPILSEKIQEKITSLVQQSHEARRKSKELLDEAKRKVEEAIENETKR